MFTKIRLYLMPIMLPMIFMMFAGFSNACMDIIDHKFGVSIFANSNENFFNPNKSWVNKWEIDAEGTVLVGKERFFGSSTFLVWLTDFWHLAKVAMLLFITLAIIFYNRCEKNLLYYVLDYVLIHVCFTIIFSICYGTLLQTL